MTNAQYAEDLRVMITADTQHLKDTLEHGDRVQAHGFTDALIDNIRTLNSLALGPELAPA